MSLFGRCFLYVVGCGVCSSGRGVLLVVDGVFVCEFARSDMVGVDGFAVIGAEWAAVRYWRCCSIPWWLHCFGRKVRWWVFEIAISAVPFWTIVVVVLAAIVSCRWLGSRFIW